MNVTEHQRPGVYSVYDASSALAGRTGGKAAGVDARRDRLAHGGPAGMVPLGFSAGETAYRAEDRRYVCPAQAQFQVWAVERTGEAGTFLDFDVRGERKA